MIECIELPLFECKHGLYLGACAHGCNNGFHLLDELERHAMNDRRTAKAEIDRDFEQFRREHV